MQGLTVKTPSSQGVAICRALMFACVFSLTMGFAARVDAEPGIEASESFNQAIFEFHQLEQEGRAPAYYLELLSTIETRFGNGYPKRRILVDAERCPYIDFERPALATDFVAAGIDRASRARMPIAESMFRLCELNLQADALDFAGLDGVIARFNALESPYQKAKAFALRADVNSVRGNLADALLDFQRARASYARAGVGAAERNLISGEGIARRRMGDFEGAEAALNSALIIWRAADNPRELAYTHIQLAYIYSDAGNQTAALQTLSIASIEAQEASDPNITSKVLLAQGLAHARSGDWKASLDAIGQTRSLLSLNDPTAIFDVAMSNYVEGMALAGTGRSKEALVALDRAEQMFTQQKNKRLIALVFKAKADVLSSQNQSVAALKVYQQYVGLEGQLQKKMRIEQSALLKQEYEIQAQEFETRQLRVNRQSQERQLEALQMTRRWQGLALLATLISLVLVGVFAWRQWRRSRKLNVLANLDPLTRLANRNGMERFAQTRISLAYDTGTPLSLLILDLDHFKVINDTYGHLVGDIVLKEVTRAWSETLRSHDLLGRFGGEEFLAICPGLNLGAAVAVANRLRAAAHSLQLGAIDPALKVTVSIGVAQYVSGETHTQLIGRADRALYAAKHLGRDRVEVAARED